MLISGENRCNFSSILDAAALTTLPDDQPAIVYLETDSDPVVVRGKKFRSAVRSYAAGLQALGIKKRSLVVIAHTQNLESIYLFWAAMTAGAIPSMFPTLTEKLDPEIYIDSMEDLVRLSDVQAIFTTASFAQKLDRIVSCPVYSTEELRNVAVHREFEDLEAIVPDPSEVAFLQHSSGTTGLQKGVALSHSSVLNQLADYSDAIALDSEDVVVSWLPLYHDMGLIAGFILPIFQGIPLVLMSPFDWARHPAMLFRAIHDHRGTLCWQPNFAYNHCARRIRQRDLEGLSVASMRMFINCSEPVSQDSYALFENRFASIGVRPEMLAVSYAMAENTFGVTQTLPGHTPNVDIVDRRALEQELRALPIDPSDSNAVAEVSCGASIVGTSVKVVDGDGLDISERQVGEIAIKSKCMLSEYYKRPDLNPFKDGWYMTGDIGYIAGEQVYVVGRSKDLIINAGKNIYPQDIESIVNEISGVTPGRAVVFGVLDDREGTELIVIVAETKINDAEQRQVISKTIRQEVSRRNMVTASYVKLVEPKWLIKTSSGKIARRANREKWLAEQRR